jgi:hypothetical protein
MKSRLPLLLAAVVIAVAMTTAWPEAGGKPTGNVGPWTCTATVEGTPGVPLGNGIASDGAGPYIHGTAGVTCIIYAPPQYTSAAQAGMLMLYFDSAVKRARSLYYPPQAASNDPTPYPGWSPGFYGGKLDVFNVSTVPIGGVGRATALSRATSKSQFRADDGQLEVGLPDTGAATIERSADGCAWTITMSADNETMALWTGTFVDRYSGNFTMRFKVNVAVSPTIYAGGTGAVPGQTINCQGNVK